MSTNPNTAHQLAERLAADFSSKDANEADTRHQIIDRLLHDILAWPHSSTKCEEYVHAGFMDYVLRDSAGRVALVIEAKREGAFFELPQRISGEPAIAQKVRLKTLTTNKDIRAAVTQVSQYCPEVGSEFACVTNGHAFIFFRTFIRGKSYLEGDAFVIPSLHTFQSIYRSPKNLFIHGYNKRPKPFQSSRRSGLHLARIILSQG